MSIAIFLLLMAVIAGLVAAGGDWMGHRAARRKIRIGGLRPRHASTLIAVLTGVIIALATYGIVLLVWRDAREALTLYGKVKADLATATRELSQFQGRLDEAEQRVADADQLVADAEAKADELNGQISGLRGQIIELTIEFDKKNQEFEKIQGQVKSLEQEYRRIKQSADSEQFRVDGLLALKDELGRDIRELEQRIAQMQEGEILLDRGTSLAYQRVGAGQRDQLGDVLQGALNRVNVNLSRDGLKIDAESAKRAEQFLASYPLEGESLIIISAARNVFEGEDVLLDFQAKSLDPLVRSGETVIELTISGSQTQLEFLGLIKGSIPAPAEFSADSLAAFTDNLQPRVVEAAREAGFLPNLSSGRISTPVASLNAHLGELTGTTRPLTVRFVADRDLNALDGVSECSIRISGQAAE
jgi:peptidoglycan hydrolase CwlO-like protein